MRLVLTCLQFIWILVVASDYAMSEPPAPDETPKTKSADVARVTIVGTLRHGAVAIGGETTGTTIESGDVVWELELADCQHTFAVDHNRQLVSVTGNLRRVRGVERGDRWIVAGDELKAVEDQDAKPQISVELRGVLRGGAQAIGGETTGTVLTANGIKWELEFTEGNELARQAKELDRQRVDAHGTLRIVRGVEVPQRLIVKVSGLTRAS